jgi:FkbM family methyltransferase
LLDRRQILEVTSIDPDDAAERYVWEVESSFPVNGEVSVHIGDLPMTLNLSFVHEKRYALGLLFGFRNPQADIDRLLFRTKLRPGDTVLDAGANIGVTAAEALACGASHVICVEPEDSLIKRLNLLRETCSNRISVLHCALGALEGVAELALSEVHNQGHTTSSAMLTLFPRIFGSQRQRVQVSTIDIALRDIPADVWKLDVEGAEADAIRGAYHTLERAPPRVILAELYDPFVEEVVNLLPQFQVRRAALATADYSLHLLDQVGGALSDEFCATSPIYVFTRSD